MVGMVGLDVGWGPKWLGMLAPLVEALGHFSLVESSSLPHANFSFYFFDMLYISLIVQETMGEGRHGCLDVGWGPNWLGMLAPLVEALGHFSLVESSSLPHVILLLYFVDMFYISY
jgi:hypothetical protein